MIWAKGGMMTEKIKAEIEHFAERINDRYDASFGNISHKELTDILTDFVEIVLKSRWINVEFELPPHGKNVLAYYKNSFGKGRTVKACYLERWKEESCANDDNYEYSEEQDKYYLKAGWYEQIDNWGEYTACVITEGVVICWQYLPPPPEGE